MAKSLEELLQDIIDRVDRLIALQTSQDINKTRLLTTPELAQARNISLSHMKALVRRGEIPSQQIGRSRRFVLEDVLSHFRVAPTPLMSVQARARRDARRIIAGQACDGWMRSGSAGLQGGRHANRPSTEDSSFHSTRLAVTPVSL